MSLLLRRRTLQALRDSNRESEPAAKLGGSSEARGQIEPSVKGVPKGTVDGLAQAVTAKGDPKAPRFGQGGDHQSRRRAVKQGRRSGNHGGHFTCRTDCDPGKDRHLLAVVAKSGQLPEKYPNLLVFTMFAGESAR
jgi:hypothetical protein